MIGAYTLRQMEDLMRVLDNEAAADEIAAMQRADIGARTVMQESSHRAEKNAGPARLPVAGFSYDQGGP